MLLIHECDLLLLTLAIKTGSRSQVHPNKMHFLILKVPPEDYLYQADVLNTSVCKTSNTMLSVSLLREACGAVPRRCTTWRKPKSPFKAKRCTESNQLLGSNTQDNYSGDYQEIVTIVPSGQNV